MDNYKGYEIEENNKSNSRILDKAEQDLDSTIVFTLESIITSISDNWYNNNIRVAVRYASALADFPFAGFESELNIIKESNFLDVVGDIIEFGPEEDNKLMLIYVIFLCLSKILKTFPIFSGKIYKAEIINQIFISVYRLNIESILSMLEFLNIFIKNIKEKYVIAFCNDCFHYQLCYLISNVKDYQVHFSSLNVLCEIFELMIEKQIQMDPSNFFKIISNKLLPNILLDKEGEGKPIISLTFHFLESVFDAFPDYHIEETMAQNFIDFYIYSDSVKVGQSTGCFLRLLKHSDQNGITNLVNQYGVEKMLDYLECNDQKTIANTISNVLYIACICGPSEINNELLEKIIQIADDASIYAKHAICQSVELAAEMRNLEFCKWLMESGILTLVLDFIINCSEEKSHVYAMHVLQVLQILSRNGLSDMILNIAIENNWNVLLDECDGSSEALEDIYGFLNQLGENMSQK